MPWCFELWKNNSDDDYSERLEQPRKNIQEKSKQILLDVLKNELTIPESGLDFEKLNGGFSNSNVYKVNALAKFSNYTKEYQLPPLVIKTNFKSGFDKEIENYENVSKNCQKILSPITQNSLKKTSFGDVRYLIMDELQDYDTLHNIVRHKKDILQIIPIISKVMHELSAFYSASKNTNRFGILFYMYAGKIQALVNKLCQKQDVFPDGFFSELIENCNCLFKILGQFEPPYTTISHGDLHARNIMVRESDFDVKLIDFDGLKNQGDYLYDLGELLCHLTEVLPIEQTHIHELPKINPEKIKLCDALRNNLIHEIENITCIFEDGDLWKKRLALSEFRFLLTCAVYSEDQRAEEYGKKAITKLSEILN